MEIIVIQTGVSKNTLTLESAEILKNAACVILHTEKCGAAEWLCENGIAFTSLDDIYESAEDFDEHSALALQRILNAGCESVCYLVMDLADETVKRLLASREKVRILGQSACSALIARAGGGFLTVSALDVGSAYLSADNDTLITEIDSGPLASEVKLQLMEVYPDETKIYVQSEGRVFEAALTELDRLDFYDHRTACLIPKLTDLLSLERYDFSHLMRLARRLRDPFNGCPWDAAQTHESLKRDALEEAYELQDAIENRDEAGIAEELGDVLFACALQIQIAVEHGEFTERDVLTGVIQKMISRHSHVFGNDRVSSLEGLFSLWDNAKKEEKGFGGVYDEMQAVAKAIPALLRAKKILKRAEKAAPEKLPAPAELTFEDDRALGDYLLRVIERARISGLDAEKALEDTLSRYIEAFR